MAGQKLRLAVVGLGRVATSHFEAIGEIGDLVELAAVMSRDEAKGRPAAAPGQSKFLAPVRTGER
jgi:predicted dehydrogenase